METLFSLGCSNTTPGVPLPSIKNRQPSQRNMWLWSDTVASLARKRLSPDETESASSLSSNTWHGFSKRKLVWQCLFHMHLLVKGLQSTGQGCGTRDHPFHHWRLCFQVRRPGQCCRSSSLCSSPVLPARRNTPVLAPNHPRWTPAASNLQGEHTAPS